MKKHDYLTLNVPRDLAEELQLIAVKDKPLKKWTTEAVDVLKSHIAEHKDN